MRKDTKSALEFYVKMNVQKVYRVPTSEFAAAICARKLDRATQHFEQVLQQIEIKNWILSILKARPGRARVTNLKSWDAFWRLWQNESLDQNDIVHYITRFCTFARDLQLDAFRILTELDIRLDLEDVNVYVCDLEDLPLKTCLQEELANLERIDFSAILAQKVGAGTHESENFDVAGSANLNGSAAEATLRKLLIKVLILSYKQLCKGVGLGSICKQLNGSAQTGFTGHFWNESVLVQILFRYSKFDLKCKLTRLLVQKGSLPMLLAHAESKSEAPRVNLFGRLHLPRRVGVMSFSVGSAARQRLGKSELLNRVLHTRFETRRSDAFASWRVEVDSGENFSPERSVAVIDCNYDDLGFLRESCAMVNILVLNVCFADVMDAFEDLEQKVAQITELCSEKEIHLLIVVRDWNHYLTANDYSRVGRDDLLEHFQNVDSENESSENESQESRSESESPDKQMLNELRRYTERVKPNKNRLTLTQNRIKVSNFKAIQIRKFKRSKVFTESESVKVIKIKNLEYSDKKLRVLEELTLALNRAVASISDSNRKFNKSNFWKICKARAPDCLEKKQIKKLCRQLSRMQSLFDESRNNPCELFPLNDFWTRKKILLDELDKLSPFQVSKKRELQSKIHELERQTARVEITQKLKQFLKTLSKSEHCYSLVTQFEGHLSQLEKQTKAESAIDRRLLDMTVYWRNIKHFLGRSNSPFPKAEKKRLVSIIESLSLKGYGFELIDGDYYTFQAGVLASFSERIRPRDRLMTLSVKGPQSSGKSTLMNSLFGTQFRTGSGICTRGVNGYLMRLERRFDSLLERVVSTEVPASRAGLKRAVNQDVDIKAKKKRKRRNKRSEFILFLDSQGMMSQELRDDNIDCKIATFIWGVSQVTLANFDGEFSHRFAELLEVSLYSYAKLEKRTSIFQTSAPRAGQKVTESQKEGSEKCKKQTMLFISNRNFNLGSQYDKSKLRGIISNSISQISLCLEPLLKGGHSWNLKDQPESIRLLGNAICADYVAKDSTLGIEESFTRLKKNPIFVKHLQKLKSESIRKLLSGDRKNASNVDPRWTFGRFGDFVRPIWNHIYYYLENYELGTIRRKLVEKEYHRVVDQLLKKHISTCQLNLNWLVDLMQNHLNSGVEYSKFCSKNLLESSSENIGYRNIFGEQGPETVSFLSKTKRDQTELNATRLHSRILEALEADFARIDKVHADSLATVENQLEEWIEHKKTNLVDLIRKQMNWQRVDLLAVYNKRKRILQFYTGVSKYNLFWFAYTNAFEFVQMHWANKLHQDIVDLMCREPIAKGDFYSNFDSKVKTFLESKASDSEAQIQEVFVKRDLLTRSAEYMTLVFNGLFEEWDFMEERDQWTLEDFDERAGAKLTQIRPRLFEVRLEVLSGQRQSSQQRFEACESLGIGLEWHQTVHFGLVKDRNQIMRGIWAKTVPECTHQNPASTWTKLIDAYCLLAKLGVIVQNPANVKMVLKRVCGQAVNRKTKKQIKKTVKNFEWNLEALAGLSNYSIFREKNMHQILLKWDRKGPNSVTVWNEAALSLFEETRNSAFARSSGRELDFNYFIHPEACESPVDLELIFEIVLNSCETQNFLLEQVNLVADDLKKKYFTKKTNSNILSQKSTFLKLIKDDVLEQLVDSLDAKLKCQAASASFELKQCMMNLLFQKVQILFRRELTEVLTSKAKALNDINWNQTRKDVYDELLARKEGLVTSDKRQLRALFDNISSNFERHVKKEISKNFENFLKADQISFSKVGITRQIESELLKELREGKSKQSYEKVLSYFRSPAAHLTTGLRANFQPKLRRFKSKAKLQNLKEQNLQEIEDTKLFFQKLRQILAENKLLNLDKSLILDQDQTNRKTFEKFNFEFLKKLIDSLPKNDFSQIYSEFGHRISAREIDLKRVFRDLDEVPDFVSRIFGFRFDIYDVSQFLLRVVENCEKLFIKILDDRFEYGIDKICPDELEKIREITINGTLGCQAKCPFCNRLCEGQRGHSGEHHTRGLGHGIIGIHSINQSQIEVKRYKGLDVDREKDLQRSVKMGEFYCHDPNLTHVILGNKLINFNIEKQRANDWNFDFAKHLKRKGKKSIKSNLYCTFWNIHNKAFCEKNRYQFAKKLNITVVGLKEILVEGTRWEPDDLAPQIQSSACIKALLEKSQTMNRDVDVSAILFDFDKKNDDNQYTLHATTLDKIRKNENEEFKIDQTYREEHESSGASIKIKVILKAISTILKQNSSSQNIVCLFFGNLNLVEGVKINKKKKKNFFFFFNYFFIIIFF